MAKRISRPRPRTRSPSVPALFVPALFVQALFVRAPFVRAPFVQAMCVLAMCVLAPSLPAPFKPALQGQTRPMLVGSVTDSDGQAVAFANVQLNGGDRVAADDSGRFRIQVPSGHFVIDARRIGCEPLHFEYAAPPTRRRSTASTRRPAPWC